MAEEPTAAPATVSRDGTPAATSTTERAVGLRARLAVVGAVVGPGLLAGLSDDDPAGITTYSQLGAAYGYRMIWVLTVSTVALIIFQDLGSRIGVVTGQGLTGLIRQRFGARAAVIAVATLFVANVGTTTAEFAGIAAGAEIFGVSRYIAVPLTAVGVSLLVLRGGFKSVERVLLTMSAVFVAYIGAGLLAGPDWGAAARGLVVPSMPLTRDALLIAVATLGTTLAPWGLAFIQSYSVDKKLSPRHLKLLRVDVIAGAVLTGVIGFFVIIATAATLHVEGVTKIDDAAQAAAALEPLAGRFASGLFAIGLIGAALLAASILPLSTAYSVSDVAGRPAALDDSYSQAPLFYGTFATVTGLGAGLVLIPGISLVPILILTQVLNAVLLLPLLVYMAGIATDKTLMGDFVAPRWMATVHWIVIVLIAICIAPMLYTSIPAPWLSAFGLPAP